MTDATQKLADELKRIRSILSVITGFEDDDQGYVEDARKSVDRIIEGLAEQPAQQGLTDFPSLLNEAEEIVRGKPVWKRFIDGTPLSNDIAVWMTVFAQDVARRTSPQPEQEPLTDEQAKSIALDVMGFAVLDKEQAKTAMMLIRGTEAAHGIKENT